MQNDTQKTKLRKNHLTYKKHIGEGKATSFFSLPWSYLIAGLCLFVIGLLDYFLLGHLIGHPEHPTFGVYVGQGIAVFLGGISFFYTVGLIPLIVGAILILYSLFTAKKISFSASNSIYRIQERRLLFPTLSELEIPSMKKITYTNKGLKFKHTWVLLFLPMAFRILQFGIPIFGEPLAQDEILPTMMVLTAIIDILATLVILLFPNHRLSFDTKDKKYSTNFFPLTNQKAKSAEIQQLFGLQVDSAGIDGDIWLFKDTAQLDGVKGGTQKNQRNYTRIIFGTILILASLIGLSLEFLWGTDLSMVGITYGIYVLFQAIIYDYSKETSLLSDQENASQQYISKNGFYFTMIHVNDSKSENLPIIEPTFRGINLVDVIGICLLLYLATLEFLWSWIFIFSLFNGIILLDLILTTIVWVALLFMSFYYLMIPINTVILGKNYSRDNLPVFHLGSKPFALNEFQFVKKTFSFPSLKRESLLRILGLSVIIVLAFLKGILI
ncbi:MAG: hypothetical protein ACTSWW_06140 [Promethearchaeota archaeon]